MNPFELFQSRGIYKIVMLYFSRVRGLAIVGRKTSGDNVEVVQLSGEVDPHTGLFTALDYPASERVEDGPVVTRQDFEKLVSYIADKIDDQTRMSVIEPEVIRSLLSMKTGESQGDYIQ